MRHQVKISQWISRVLVAALILTATPLPTFAGEPPGPPAPAPAPTLSELVKQAAAVTPIPPVRAQAQTGASAGRTDFGSPSFFKKPVGIAVLCTLAAGVGYAIYSTQNDRIHSPAKQ